MKNFEVSWGTGYKFHFCTCRGGVSWTTCVFEGCRGDFASMSWVTGCRGGVSWGLVQHVVGYNVSWRGVVGTGPACRGLQCVVEGCRGDWSSMSWVTVCRGGVSWGLI